MVKLGTCLDLFPSRGPLNIFDVKIWYNLFIAHFFEWKDPPNICKWSVGLRKIAHFVHFIPLYIMTLTKTMYHTKKKFRSITFSLKNYGSPFFLREKWLVDFSIRRHRQTSPHMQQISSAEIFFFFKLEIKYTCLEHLYIFIFRLKTRHTLKKNLKALVWCASADLCLEFI